jgi:tRNA U38,U39,U40 pseudouridine synthase TruA
MIKYSIMLFQKKIPIVGISRVHLEFNSRSGYLSRSYPYFIQMKIKIPI